MENGERNEERDIRDERRIRLLIVEDEATIRNGMLRHVPWTRMGVDEVCASENAEEALRALPDYLPDIVLTDIRMPGMDGTELARIIRQKLPDCQIAFISGYSDKEYLQAAISLGVVGYVEKPIETEDLSTVIQKAIDAVWNIRKLRAATLHDLIHNPDQPGEDDGTWEHFVVFAIKTKQPQNPNLDAISDAILMRLNKEGKCYCSAMTDKVSSVISAILINAGEDWGEEQTKTVCQSILSFAKENDDWFVAASKEQKGKNKVSAAYREAVDTLCHLSYKGWGSFALAGEESSEYSQTLSEEESRSFYRMIAGQREKEALMYLNGLYRSLVESHTVMNFYVRNAFHTLDQAIYRACIAQPGMEKLTFSDQGDPYTLDTIEELRNVVRSHIEEAMRQLDGHTKTNYQIREVCDYIQSHLGDKDLSLTCLADTVYLTPAYLSAMFSKNMGITVGQYITDARIAKAAELLKDPKYKLYQVAEMVGYEDPKYFAKLFKKKMGVTPKEYRDTL